MNGKKLAIVLTIFTGTAPLMLSVAGVNDYSSVMGTSESRLVSELNKLIPNPYLSEGQNLIGTVRFGKDKSDIDPRTCPSHGSKDMPSAQICEEDIAKLKDNIPYLLLNIMEIVSNNKQDRFMVVIEIHGHASRDNNPKIQSPSPKERARNLGEDRARYVANVISEYGLLSDKVKADEFKKFVDAAVIISKADDEPSPEETNTQLGPSRRTDIYINIKKRS